MTFFLGSCVMAVVWGILALVDPPESRWEQVEPWMYFGGPLGASYVVASILFAPIVGVANFFVAGMLLHTGISDHVIGCLSLCSDLRSALLLYYY